LASVCELPEGGPCRPVGRAVPVNRGLSDWTRYGTIGFSWVFLTAVLLYAGYRGGQWLDARWGMEPVGLVLGLVAAVALSLTTLIQELRAVSTAMGINAGPQDGREEEPPSPKSGRHPGNE